MKMVEHTVKAFSEQLESLSAGVAQMGGRPQHSGLHVDASAVPIEQGGVSEVVVVPTAQARLCRHPRYVDALD